MKKIALSVFTLAVLSGCATATTGAVPIGEGLHTITRQGNGAWVSTNSLKNAAIIEADAHCKRDGKSFKLVHSKEIQSGPGRWPEAEILFKCE